MQLIRPIIAFWLILTLLPLAGLAAAVSANPLPTDDYDRLRAGVKIMQERVYEPPVKPTVYLTFDDGPGRLTPKVLDILKDEQVPATFFVLGEYVNQYPEHVKRTVAEGHRIGNHTYNHQYKSLYPSYALFKAQIEKTEQALQEQVGVTTSLIRAPGGTFSHFDSFYFYYLDQAGYSIFDWNVDSGDARRANVPSPEIIQNITSTPLKHEMVVLMHDGSGHEETVRALPAVIRFYKEKGYQFEVLSPQVKPVQSPVDKRVQSSPITLEEHEYWLANALAAASRHETNQLTNPSYDPVESVKSEVKSELQEEPTQQAPPLKIHFGPNQTLELASPSYAFRQDKFFVPLRALAEQMGAQVTWDGEARMATVRYGMYQMEVDLKRNSISVQAPGKNDRVHYLTDMSLKDGSIMVPLRSTIELLGNQVSSYSIKEDSREVSVDLSLGGYVPLMVSKTRFNS